MLLTFLLAVLLARAMIKFTLMPLKMHFKGKYNMTLLPLVNPVNPPPKVVLLFGVFTAPLLCDPCIRGHSVCCPFVRSIQ